MNRVSRVILAVSSLAAIGFQLATVSWASTLQATKLPLPDSHKSWYLRWMYGCDLNRDRIQEAYIFFYWPEVGGGSLLLWFTSPGTDSYVPTFAYSTISFSRQGKTRSRVVNTYRFERNAWKLIDRNLELNVELGSRALLFRPESEFGRLFVDWLTQFGINQDEAISILPYITVTEDRRDPYTLPRCYELKSAYWRGSQGVDTPSLGRVLVVKAVAAHRVESGAPLGEATEFKLGEAVVAFVELDIPPSQAGIIVPFVWRWIAPSGEVLEQKGQFGPMKEGWTDIWAQASAPSFEAKVRQPIGAWQVEFSLEGIVVATIQFRLVPQ